MAGEDDRKQAETGLPRLVVPATIFLAALLLFAIEPLIAKMILPWFGGSSAVWMACLLFFQTALLCGYLYAHLLATRVPRHWQARAHVTLLIASLAFLPVIPAAHWRPSGGENPLILILGLLAATIGLPFLLLASTTPLLTAWSARRGPSTASLTRLYALSNLGSMIALISYPVLIEPMLTTRFQAWSWSGIYAGFVLLAAAAAWRLHAAPPPEISMPRDEAAPPSTIAMLFWLLLPMASSALLLAVTNHILRNIAAIPLLWVAPLALYLFSFVVAFDSPRWYFRPVWYGWFAAMSGLMIYVMTGLFLVHSFLPQLLFYLAGFFVCCMVCHGELAALKPSPGHLSAYYLIIAAGGTMGGVLVAGLAPLLFPADFDIAIVLPATVLLIIWVVFWRWPPGRRHLWRAAPLTVVLLALALDAGQLAWKERGYFTTAVFTERNFYGALRVSDDGSARMLQNGNVVHGREFLAPEKARQPVSYYGPGSGLGLAMASLQARGPVHVGVVGLGTGSIAGFGRPGDTITYYEINPAMPNIAENYFRFLSLSGAKWNIQMGDARLSLERAPPQKFDLLAIDAFTSDSIPVHLLTREAFALYWRHLKPGGVLAVHVSNLYIDLAPVVAAATLAEGKTARLISYYGEAEKQEDYSDWVLITADPGFFDIPALAQAGPQYIPASVAPWTDDYSNLWRSLR